MLLKICLASLTLLVCQAAHADAVGDLKTALNRLQGRSELKAMLDTKTWHKLGEGNEVIETQGQANINLEYLSSGLRLNYSQELLGKLESEKQAKQRDPNSKTPSLNALREFDIDQVRQMISAAPGLARTLERAILQSEKLDSYAGKPARLLVFALSEDTLGAAERKYIKKIDSRLSVWIDANGVPLASQVSTLAKGRVFIFISFEAKSEVHRVYQQHADHLLITQMESSNLASGVGERSEQKMQKVLRLM